MKVRIDAANQTNLKNTAKVINESHLTIVQLPRHLQKANGKRLPCGFYVPASPSLFLKYFTALASLFY